MTTAISLTDIKSWLKSTKLTEEEQNDFISRYKLAGHFTPQLSEEFAEILAESLDVCDEELQEYNNIMSERTSELEAMNKELDERYETLVTNLTTTIHSNNEKAAEETRRINSLYDEIMIEQDSKEVTTILDF